MNHEMVPPSHLSYDLLKEITDDFSEERLIGSGGYGKVYKGVHKDGKKIAVKILFDTLRLDDEQFKKEFNNLKCVQHYNIVRLVGYCNETKEELVQYNGRVVHADKIYRALCFEYMHNGSLQEHIFDEHNGHDWHTRYRIIKGIWNGLKYLHNELESPMYHLDLKPANILLDENMVAKIADFGLSRLFGEEHTRITNSAIGTWGYLPLEYIKSKKFSNKFDIFSLGVVTIKIIAGPEGFSKFHDMPSSKQFIEHVHANWRDRLQQNSAYEPESYCEQVKTCIEMALSCVDSDRHKRPSIEDIVHKMNETEAIILLWPSIQESRVRERLSKIENIFGEVVDNCKLDKMARFMGKPKTQQDRAREALNLVGEKNKETVACRHVWEAVSTSGFIARTGTLCLLYNATGDTLYYVADHDWAGHIGSPPYPKEIGNGQWAAFHHARTVTSSSTGAVVYRGKNIDGPDQDYLLAWNNPRLSLFRNKSYCEIGGVDYFQTCWDDIHHKLKHSNCSSNAKSDKLEIDTAIGESPIPKFIAIICPCRSSFHNGNNNCETSLGQLHWLNQCYQFKQF